MPNVSQHYTFEDNKICLLRTDLGYWKWAVRTVDGLYSNDNARTGCWGRRAAFRAACKALRLLGVEGARPRKCVRVFPGRKSTFTATTVPVRSSLV